MTDLHQSDPKLNVYFQDKRIRQYLIKARLINRHGDIIPPDQIKKQTRKKPSKTNKKPSSNENQKGEDDARQLYREFCQSLSNVQNPPSTTKKKRSKSARHLSSDSKRSLGRSPKKEKPPVPERCRVTMIYYGQQMNIDYDNCWFRPKGDEIVILQQHCGGENLIVFKGYCKPNETFTFDSRRHPDYPFALSFYINGLIDSRISVCCEYRHKKNVPLGGKHGFFAITDVQKVKPCQSCRTKRRKKKSKSTITLALEPSRYQKSVVPRLSSRNQSYSPINREMSSTPTGTLTTKRRSPNVSRTPTPPRRQESPISSTTSSSHSRVVPTIRPSNIKKPETPPKSDEEIYSSDFDEPKEDARPKTARYGRPRISDSDSIKKDEDDSPRSSPISKKSDPLENEIPKSLTRRDNDERSLSSSNSRKSVPSPKYEVDQKNEDVKNRLLSIITSNNDTENQRLPSPTTKEIENRNPPRHRRTLSDEFFDDKTKDSRDLSSILYGTNNKTDRDDNDDTNTYSTPKSKSWLKDSDDDDDD